MTPIRLNNASLADRGGPDRPHRVRIVHIGLGNFHRAHQAWYTSHAVDAGDWGIAAFTGRSPDQARALAPQDGLYTLVVRGDTGDRVEIVPSIIEVHDAADVGRFASLLRRPSVAIVTLTVTESGYRLRPDGTPDLADATVAADLAALRRAIGTGQFADAVVSSPLARLLLGLETRRRADAGPIAIVPCDNIPDNGAFVARGLRGLASEVSSELADWIASEVSFVSTSVDRITPRIEGEVAAVEESGWIDASPVVTEPFSDWVLSGAFPAGRPSWETAGARFVDDIEPWENRKLWLLNGAHSILAFAGLARGHETVASAIADARCHRIVDEFWAEAVQHLPPGIEHVQYRRDLISRFGNRRIVHRLEQIAGDATSKVRYRFVPVAERSLARGLAPEGSARAIAAWMHALRLLPAEAESDRVASAIRSEDPIRALLEVVSPRLATDAAMLAEVRRALLPEQETAPAQISSPRT